VTFWSLCRRLDAARPFLFGLALWLSSFSLAAERNYWTALDPARLRSTSLAADPFNSSEVYAAGPIGVCRTTDRGHTWQSCSYGLRGPVTALAAHPTSPGSFYAATYSGVFRTTDGGARWAPVGGIEDRRLEDIEIDPQDPRNLYAIAGGLDSALLKSTDGGLSWSPLTVPMSAAGPVYPIRIAVHPQDSQLLLLAAWQGLFRSTDAGTTWSSVGTWQDNRPLVFAFDRSDASRIYAGANRYVWISTDRGETWRQTGDESMQGISAIAVDPSNPSNLYLSLASSLVSEGHLRKSTDRGETWAPLLAGSPWGAVRDLLVDRSTPSRLWFATDDGLLLSEDAAVSWKPTTEGASESGLYNFTVDPSDSRTIYAANSSGLVRSEDGGISWSPINSYNALEYTAPTVIAIEPGNSDVIYVAGSQVIYRTDDRGATWEVVAGIRAHQILINPANPRHLYILDISNTLKRSTDRGEIWITSKLNVSAVAFDPTVSSLVYATGPDGIYRSADSGLIWTYIEASYGIGYPTHLLVDPSDSSSLLAGTVNKSGDAEIWAGADRGDSWTRRVVFPRGQIHRLVADPRSPLVLYASLNQGFSRSADGGRTWVLLDHGAASGDPEERCYPGLFAFDTENPWRLLAPSSRGLYEFLVAPSINFPWAASDGVCSTGLTFVNLSNDPLQIRLEAREADGNLASGPGIQNPMTLNLDRGEQTAAQLDELFGPLSGKDFQGWVRAFIDHEPAPSFFSVFSPDLQVLDTIDAGQTLRPFAFLPIIHESGNTLINLVNPHPRAALAQIQLIGDDGITRKEITRIIPAEGRISFSPDEFFGVETAPSDYVRASADLPLAFFALFDDRNRRLAGLNGVSLTLSSPILIPQFVVGHPAVRSTLHLIGSLTNPAPVIATVRSDNGSIAGSTVLDLGMGKKRLTGEELFPGLAGKSFTGYLELRPRETGQEWQAAVTFEDPDGSRFLTALPSVSAPSSEYVLSHLASDASFFTGIAVVNRNNQPTEVTIDVYRPDGQPLGSATLAVPANGRISKVLTEWLPELQGKAIYGGYARVRSTQPVACFGVFGPYDLSSYAAVPAQ